jgi:hypothetical protein
MCVSCAKRGCEKCFHAFGKAQPSPAADMIPQWACSRACFELWIGRAISHGFSPIPWGNSWAIEGTVLESAYAPQVNHLAEQHRVKLRLQHALNLLKAERFEDAAKVYESLSMWKEAGEARRNGKRNVVTQVQVDVNNLIDQVKKGGLTTSYACPACQSPIRIDSSADVGTLRHCQYCGTAIQSTDLVDFLSRVVGYR